TDLRAVLRDYSEEMMLPALEVFTEGLMVDSTMYDAFRGQDQTQGEAHDYDVATS
ncbi:TetR/AcrR family transcriptional regulator, partial [Mycolicibacterium elephantis]